MVKIALLICGTIRNYKENYLSWKKHLFDLFDVTIFLHTYNVTGYHLGNNNILLQQDINELINIIKPKKYLIESYEHKINEFKNMIKTQCLRRGSAKPECIKSQLYSIYMANKLKKIDEKENNYKYDVVIKIRFDTIFYSNFNINDINLILNNNNVILCGNPNIKTMLYKIACKNCINNFNNNKFIKCNVHTDISDIVIMSTSKIIDYYAKIYLTYDLFINQYHNKVINKYNSAELTKYINKDVDYNCTIYNNVPQIEYLYPEKVLGLYLIDFILLNYTINLDINRNIIDK